jgi:hypothetical protein
MSKNQWHRSLIAVAQHLKSKAVHGVHRSVLLCPSKKQEFLVPPCCNFASKYGRLVDHFPFSSSGDWMDGEGSDEIKLNYNW